MSAEISLETQRLLDRATFEWQPLEPVLQEMMALVAPGKALRRYDAIKARSDAERTGTGPERPLSDTEKVRSGARRIVRDSFKNMCGRGRMELRQVGEIEEFRFVERRKANLKPCSNCGHVENPTMPESKPNLTALAETKKPMSNVLTFPQRQVI